MDEPLIGNGPVPLPVLRQHSHSSEPRRATNRTSKWAFILLGIAVLVGGACNGYRAKGRFVDWVGEVWNPEACPVAAYPSHTSLQYSRYQLMGIWSLGSVVASFLAAAILIYMFKVHALGVTLAAVLAQVLAPLCCGLYLCLTALQDRGQRLAGGVLLGAGVMLALLQCCARKKLVVVARMFQVAAFSLDSNGGLIWWVLCLWCAWVSVLGACMGFTSFTLASAKLLPNHMATVRKVDECLTVTGTRTTCCTYQLQAWDVVYLVSLWTFFCWCSTIIFQLRLFVMAGVISHWYFTPHQGADHHCDPLRKSVYHALGPQFGTSALGASLLWFVQLLRTLLKPVPLRPRNTLYRLACCPCSLVARWTVASVECVSTFATIMASLTGADFFSGGAAAVDMLRRSQLRTVYVWWLPNFVVNAAMLMLGVAWGVVVYNLAVYLHWTGSQDAAASLALLCGAISVVVLLLVGSVLLNIVDVLYLCYGLDRERFCQTRVDVHVLFHELPVHTEHVAPPGLPHMLAGGMLAGVTTGGHSLLDAVEGAFPGTLYTPPPVVGVHESENGWSSYGYSSVGGVHAGWAAGGNGPPAPHGFAPPPLYQEWS